MTGQGSALVVTVKQTLVGWVRRQGIRRPYLRQEDCVWLVPWNSGLPGSVGHAACIDAMKDQILDAELERFALDLRARILRDHAFDDLIQISIREHVVHGPAIDRSVDSAGPAATAANDRISDDGRGVRVRERNSALVVTVKPTLLEWVKSQGVEATYRPEDSYVWLTPEVSSFGSAKVYIEYLNELKERILDAELQHFGVNLRERILRKHSFEELIELDPRDDVETGPSLASL